MKTNIEVPKFVLIITFLTGLIATVLGIWASLSPETHPQFLGEVKSVLSWSGRELGLGLSCLLAVFFLRDARVIMAVLFGSWIRETLDFIDFFRLTDTPTRLYVVVGVSVILHSMALYLTWKAIVNTESISPKIQNT
ncbi:MAG: hypothetical protein R8P61_34090 [Bacteroidia bacterium]|nr:hypothetical protein [Bacteroidia bacterium]